MKVFALLAVCIVALSATAPSQSPAQLKQELTKKEAAAKKDPEALFAAGQWATEKAMAVEAKRIFQAVLKIKPDHEGANTALGNELVDGKWIPTKEAEAARKKVRDAEFAAKGMVEVSGVWVEKEQVDDAKRGIFHHGEELVTKEEKLALLAGKVRHPITGELIDGKHAAEAEKRYFPVANGRWADEKEADTFHSDSRRPWIVRTEHCLLVSTLPIAKLIELKTEAELAIESVSPLLGSPKLHPKNRPAVIVAASQSEFTELGTSLGDETSSSGAWLMRDEAKMSLAGYGETRGAVCWNHKEWGARYLRHAVALAYANNLAEANDETLPLWLLNGLGGYTSRLQNAIDTSHFAKQHLDKGGLRPLKGFFSGFAINGEMDPKDIDANIFQAGLLLHYTEKGNDADVAAAFKELTTLLINGGGKKGALGKVVAKYEAALIASEAKIAAHLKQVAR